MPAAQPITHSSVLTVFRESERTRRRRNTALVVGVIVVGVWVLVAALAPWIAPHSPTDLDIMNRLEPPQPGHWFGTDEAGRDNFSRVLYGARITMPVAFTVIALATVFGAAVGAVAGYLGGRTDEILMRIVDIVLAFPPIVLAMAITAALGAGLRNAMLAILLVSWPETMPHLPAIFTSVARPPTGMLLTSVLASPAMLMTAMVWPSVLAT